MFDQGCSGRVVASAAIHTRTNEPGRLVLNRARRFVRTVAGLGVALSTCFGGDVAIAETAREGQTPRYRIVNGRGWSVCEAYLKNLNAFPRSDPPMVCEQKIHPTHPEFQLPQWEPMDLDRHLPLVYAVVALLPPYSVRNAELPAFEDWKLEFLSKIEKQELAPRLSRVRLALNERGIETVILYEPDIHECDRHRAVAGGHIFVLRDDGLETVAGSGHRSILLYRGKPFFVLTTTDGFDKWGTTLQSVFRKLPGRQSYELDFRCEIQFEK